MKRIRGIFAILLIFLISFSLSACGATTEQFNQDSAMIEEQPMVADVIENGIAGVGTESIELDVDKEQEELDSANNQKKQKITYSCNIELETLQYEESISKIKELIDKYDGFVERNEQTNNANGWYYDEESRDSMTSEMRIRIPEKHYREFVDGLNDFGKVMSFSETATNITRQYGNTQTKIEVLETEKEMLMDMMQRATTIQDMIQVESRLYDVQSELQAYQNSLEQMDLDVGYSTIDLRITEVFKQYSSQITFSDELKDALDSSMITIRSLIIFIVYLLPILFVLSIISLLIVVCVLMVKKRVGRRKQKVSIEDKKSTEDTKRQEKEKK